LNLRSRAQSQFSRLSWRLGRRSATLILSEAHRLPQSQVWPLVHWQRGLGLKPVVELDRWQVQERGFAFRGKRQFIFIQSWWNTPADALAALLTELREAQPQASLVYLDWFAPIHIPQPWVMERVDLYVKKHVLADRTRYGTGFHDTNLIEYEARWDESLLHAKEAGLAPELLQRKLFVGWNFAMAPGLIKLFRRHVPDLRNRSIAVHCRIGAGRPERPWYHHMRQRNLDAARQLSIADCLITDEGVPFKQYWRELTDSRLCFSPFGFGEVCWRDFEAVAAGAVLVKPDMSHIETYPDIYRPHETYVPVRWDLADLEERCHEYLNDPAACERLVANAGTVWQRYLEDGFRQDVAAMIQRLTADTTNTDLLTVQQATTLGT